MQPRRIGLFQIRIHVLRHSLHVQVDRHIVLGRDVGQQQHQRMIGGRIFIILHRRLRQREMFSGHLAESGNTAAQQFFGLIAKFALRLGSGVAAAIGGDNHSVQRAAAAKHHQLVRKFLRGCQDLVRIPCFRIVRTVGFGLDESPALVQTRHRLQQKLHGFRRPVLVDVDVRIDIRRARWRQCVHARRHKGGPLLAGCKLRQQQ